MQHSDHHARVAHAQHNPGFYFLAVTSNCVNIPGTPNAPPGYVHHVLRLHQGRTLCWEFETPYVWGKAVGSF